MKALPPNAGAARRAHLRSYVLGCLQDNLLAWSDLTSPAATVDKVLRVVKEDAREVLAELGQNGGANGLRLLGGVIGQKLMGLAEDLEARAGKGRRS